MNTSKQPSPTLADTKFAKLKTAPGRAKDTLAGAISEFGEELERLVAESSGAIGAVITDGGDDVVDLAFRSDRTNALEVSLAGAQIGRSASKLHSLSVISGLGIPFLVLEGESQSLMSHQLLDEYLLTLVLDRSSNLARALRELERSADRLMSLLES